MKKVYTAAFKGASRARSPEGRKNLEPAQHRVWCPLRMCARLAHTSDQRSAYRLERRATMCRPQGDADAAARRPLRPDRFVSRPSSLAEKKAATLAYRIPTSAHRAWRLRTLSLATQTHYSASVERISTIGPYAPSAREVAIKHRIDELFTEWPFYGSRKLHARLLPAFGPLARNTVRRYMQAMGLWAIYPGPKLRRRHPDHRVYPYLLRNVTAAHPNHIWGVDITYVRVRGSWLYLVAILDWFSRYVAVGPSLTAWRLRLCSTRWIGRSSCDAHDLEQRSRQSFTAPLYQRLKAKACRSHGWRGRAFDNIFTERFWRSLKYEEVYLHDYGNPREARQGITRYIGLYNHKRPHAALEYQTPVAWYFWKACLTTGKVRLDACGGPARPAHSRRYCGAPPRRSRMWFCRAVDSSRRA